MVLPVISGVDIYSILISKSPSFLCFRYAEIKELSKCQNNLENLDEVVILS